MNELQAEGSSKIDTHLKDQYGDQYPIIWCDPELDSILKKTLKDLIQANKLIHPFRSSPEAREFAQSLGISFIVIVPEDASEQKLFQEFSSLELTYGRRMGKLEEEEALSDLIKGASDKILKSMKAYVFFTQSDYLDETSINAEEEEVTAVEDINSLAKEFRQEFAIILYDPNMSSERKDKLVQDLEIEIEERNLFTNFLNLLKQIKNYKGPPYHLVMFGKDLDEKTVNEVTGLKDLLGLYIYRDDDSLDKINHEKIDKAKTLEELIPQIKQGLRTRSKLRQNFPAFAPDFGAWDRSHINYVHHYLKGFIHFNNRKQAKEDFIKLAQKIYQDKSKLLFQFQGEYTEYNKEKILHWYTKDSPIYRLINNCLRIASSDSIIYCRFGLKDMERAIRDQYQGKDKDFTGVVYRGAYISSQEWEQLERNIGQEIEMHGFLSTTLTQKVALNFLKGDPENKIFIMILVPPLPELDDQGFAYLSSFSEYPAEKEILFNVRSKFQILQAFTNKNKTRFLILLYGAQLLRKYMTQHNPSINIELELQPKETIQCDMCGNGKNLFGFQEGMTQVRCFECLAKNPIPKDTPILSLNEKNMKNEKLFAKKFPGKMLKFAQGALSFAQSDYKCCDCQGDGKKSYYKWIAQDGKDIKQCSDCFEKKKEVKAEILVSETYPYTLWLEHQREWEKIDTEYKTGLSKNSQDQNEGNVYNEVRDFPRCIEYGKRVLKKLKLTRRRERQKMMTYHMLGIAYESLANHEEAKICFKMAISIGKSVSDPFTITLYNNLADVYESLGRHELASENYKEALKIAKLVCGEENLLIATSYNGLAFICNSQGREKEALGYFEDALQITKRILGENHPETATSYNNIACVYRSLGMFTKAKESFTEAYKLKDAIFGENHPETALSYHNRAEMYKDFGEYETAIEYFEKAIKIGERFYGEKHTQTAASYNGLGSVLRLSKRYQEAINYSSKALELTTSIKGEFHKDTAVAYSNLGLVCRDVKHFKKALAFLVHALEIGKTLYGEVHPSVATSYTNLALLYSELKSHKQALSYAIKSLNLTISIYGEMHRDTANSYNNLGRVYEAFRDYPKVIENYAKALRIYEYIFGNRDHPEIALIYFNLGCVLKMQGLYQQAKDYLQKSCNMRTRLFGFESSEMMESLMQLGDVDMLITGKSVKSKKKKGK